MYENSAELAENKLLVLYVIKYRNFGCIFEKDVEGTVYCRFFPLQKFQLFFQ